LSKNAHVHKALWCAQEARVPIPMLLAVGAVHHRLVKAGLRSDTSIVAEAAQCVSTHHVALLVGYGAHAVCPYLALEAARQWRVTKRTQSIIKSGKLPDISIRAAQRNYKKARSSSARAVRVMMPPRSCCALHVLAHH
jgi:Glutamate synthase central domain